MLYAFTVGGAQDFGIDYGNMAGLLVPTHDKELCNEVDDRHDLNKDGDIDWDKPEWTLESTFVNYGPTTLPTGSFVDLSSLYKSFGLQNTFLKNDDWCSEYNDIVQEVAGGQ